MAKLYFKYGSMGSSKTVQALITKHNYENAGKKVLLLKSATDTRDGANIIRSRLGIEAEAYPIQKDSEVFLLVDTIRPDVIICDEAQFFSPGVVDALHHVAAFDDIPVLCFGLLTDFQTHLFTGSKRLIETAESIKEIQMICNCGKKSTVNARIIDGKIVTKGDQIFIGGDESYQAMCYECFRRKLTQQEEEEECQ